MSDHDMNETSNMLESFAEPEDATEEIVQPALESVFGVVVDCTKLIVRAMPNKDSKIITVLDAASQVAIDVKASTDAFYKVCTAVGVEGFCMEQYIALVGQ